MNKRVSWLNHTFSVHSLGTNWASVGGIYIFCGLDNDNRWVPQYIGQTSSFKERLSNHERWDQAVELGSTHIHARTIKNTVNRTLIESELIEAFQPKLNTNLR